MTLPHRTRRSVTKSACLWHQAVKLTREPSADGNASARLDCSACDKVCRKSCSFAVILSPVGTAADVTEVDAASGDAACVADGGCNKDITCVKAANKRFNPRLCVVRGAAVSADVAALPEVVVVTVAVLVTGSLVALTEADGLAAVAAGVPVDPSDCANCSSRWAKPL
jgi:hypothetical protein